MSNKRVALIHDWCTGMRGGEKVLDVLCELFPEADLYTLVYVPGKLTPRIENRRIFASSLQQIPQIDKYYRHFLPLMPRAIEQFNFSGYDALISTSHCVAKGARPRSGATHWSYCHTPMRYVWDQYEEYFSADRASFAVRMAMRLVRPYLQRWDVRTVSQVTHFLANSKNVQERIQRIYRRDSRVIYPPVDHAFYSEPGASLRISQKPFYLMVSAFAPYKRVDLVVEAFNRSGKRLVIIGDGQESLKLKALAKRNIEFLGWLDAEALRWHYQNCEALLFPGVEDFGIVPLEAMSAGRPVVAYRKGGALETVVEGKTGLFFDQQTPEAIQATLERFQPQAFDPAAIQAHAHRFDRNACKEQFRQCFVEVL